METDLIHSSFKTFTSVDQSALNSFLLVEQAVYYSCPPSSLDATLKEIHVLSQPKLEKCFNHSEFSNLEIMYKELYPEFISMKLSRFFFELQLMEKNTFQLVHDPYVHLLLLLTGHPPIITLAKSILMSHHNFVWA